MPTQKTTLKLIIPVQINITFREIVTREVLVLNFQFEPNVYIKRLRDIHSYFTRNNACVPSIPKYIASDYPPLSSGIFVR